MGIHWRTGTGHAISPWEYQPVQEKELPRGFDGEEAQIKSQAHTQMGQLTEDTVHNQPEYQLK